MSPGDCAELIRAVETGDIDVTFIEIGPHETGPLEVRPLLDDPMVFVAPAAAPEAGQRVVSIADIAHLPMIGTRNRRMPADHRRRLPPGARLADLRLPFRRHPDHPGPDRLRAGLRRAATAHGGRARSERGRHPHPARAPAPPARDRMASRAHAAAGPPRPLSKRRPRSVATSTSSGRRREPPEHRVRHLRRRGKSVRRSSRRLRASHITRTPEHSTYVRQGKRRTPLRTPRPGGETATDRR